MYNTFQTLILASARDWTVKSQVSKPWRLLIETVVSKWERRPVFPPSALSIHPRYKNPSRLCGVPRLNTTPLLKPAGIKTDSSIPDDRCRHLPTESHRWLQRPSIYSAVGGSGGGEEGGEGGGWTSRWAGLPCRTGASIISLCCLQAPMVAGK